jgi:hypothetical protein
MKSILAFLLLASPLFASEVCIEAKSCSGTACETVRGSGVVVHHDPVKGVYQIVTARHVVEGTTDAKVSDGEQWLPVQSIHWLTAEDDFAVLVIKYSGTRFKVTPISEKDAAPGDEIRWSGFSGGKRHETMTGQAREVGSVGFATCQIRCKQGQSGGGVYNEDGEVIGWVKGYNTENGELIYTPVCHIRRRCAQRWGWFFGLGIGGWAEPMPPRQPYQRPQQPQPQPTPRQETLPAPAEPRPAQPPAPPVERTPLPTAPIPATPATPSNQAAVDSLKSELKTLRIEFDKLKYTQIPVRIETPDGKLFDSVKVRLDKSVPKDDPKLVDGQPIILRLTPKPKAN